MSDYRVKSTYQSTASDSTDKILLAAAFSIGIIGSVSLKIYGVNVWVPAAFSAAVIIIYALCAYFLPRVQLESDQVGDNAYYLGFVLTLTSLSFTLYELSGSDAQVEFIAEVIAGFGIALSSTIVGVAVRVMFLQFRVDLVARDREARLSLNDAMRQFRAELADTIRGVKYLGVEIRQSLNEHHAALAKSNAEASQSLHDEMLASFRGALKPVGAQLQKMTNEVIENAASAVSSSEAARTKSQADLTAALAVASNAITEESRKMAVAIQASAEASNKQIEIFGRQLEAHVIELSKSIGSLTQAAVAQLSQAAGSVSRNSEQLSNTSAKAIETATASVVASVNSVNLAVGPAGEALGKSMEELAAKLAVVITEFQKRSDEIRALSIASQTDQRDMFDRLTSLTTSIDTYTKQLLAHESASLAKQQHILEQLVQLKASIPAVTTSSER